jgi:hypothetical protein
MAAASAETTMDLKSYWKIPWMVLALAIVLLSGVLAVVKDAIVAVTGRAAAPSLFWVWLRIAFFVAAMLLLVQQRRQLTRRDKQGKEELEAIFSDLMRDGNSIKEEIKLTQNLHLVNNELIRKWREWKGRVESALRDAGWLTDSEAFSRASENPSGNVLGSYVHIPETKRLYVVQLKIECDKLEQIVQRRLSPHPYAANNSFNSHV